MPDFTYRYMTDDILFGLVVIRGIEEIVGFEKPNIDKVLKGARSRCEYAHWVLPICQLYVSDFYCSP